MSRILFLDIETTHLKADFGTLLCVGFKELGEKKATIVSLRDFAGWKTDPTNDKKVVKAAREKMADVDIWVTYYGKGFDIPYMNAKFLEHGLEVLPNTPHLDLFFTVKSNLALSRKSLANVGYFLKLSKEKTMVEGRIWKKAMVGHEPSLKYIEDHCEADVDILEEAYLKLRPLIRTHPRVGELGACRFCGTAGRLQKRGRATSVLKGPRTRVHCTQCGSWDLREEKDVSR